MAPFWHRWSYFAIINLSVFHLADKCFTITNLINLRIILFLEYRKTPETLRFRGILRLDTMLSYDNKSIFRLYYSMIVATRPDPTVRPPSRIANVRPWLHSDWVDEFDCHLYVITRHAHLCTSWKVTYTSYISCSEVELWTIVVEEWCMTTTLVLCQNVNLSCELCMTCD